MTLEVEQKFPVADLAALAARLAALGAPVSPPQTEVDLYFAHPARDFAKTDEALRIRRKGQSHYLTYKGPKIDATTKTRREIELPLGSEEGSAAAWTELLKMLGFSPVAEVRKSRRKAGVAWQGRQIEASLDEVERLGTFAELELVVEENDLEPAKACIASLAAALGLVGGQRRSYLELLLAAGVRGQGSEVRGQGSEVRGQRSGVRGQ
jgi:adenylate cyclase class 2